MRAFIAAALPDEVRGALRALQQKLALSGADVKWVEPDHLHVTLKFLGEIDEEQRRGVEALMARSAADQAPFTAALGGLGGFPSMAAPRVIWAGLGAGQDAFVQLAERLESGSGRLRLPASERPFSAHLTLGRVRSPRGLGALVRALQTMDWTPPPPWAVERVTLYQSVLGAGGPRYTVLAEVPLNSP